VEGEFCESIFSILYETTSINFLGPSQAAFQSSVAYHISWCRINIRIVDKAYDASAVREFASSEGGYTTHIKVNRRKKYTTESSGRSSQQRDSHGEPHPARRWVVERTISWLTKRRSLRTRWSKKAENWLALIQLACAHVLLNLAVFG
jgi:transposase